MNSTHVGGFIGSSGLEEWWLTAFNESERKHIVDTFQPMGADAGLGNMLIDGPTSSTPKRQGGFLGTVATWFRMEANRTIAYRLIEKAEQLLRTSDGVISQHFFFQSKAVVYYRWRETDAFAFGKAIEACKQQIALAPFVVEEFSSNPAWGFVPAHHGYRQLVIIEEKRKNFEEAIQLCLLAKSQGWQDDWDHRIERLTKKLEKVSRGSGRP